jgi:hypothetical protein
VTRDIQEKKFPDRGVVLARTAEGLKNTSLVPRQALVTFMMRWSQWLGRKRRLPPFIERILRSYSALNW